LNLTGIQIEQAHIVELKNWWNWK